VADGLQVRFEVTPSPALRNALGQYTSEGAQGQYNENRVLAQMLSVRLGLLIATRVNFGKRAAASSKRLERTSVSRENTVVTKEFVGIGRPDWLDRSNAKYWRTFEEGSAAVWRHPFVGTFLFPKGRVPYPQPGGHGSLPGLRTAREPFLHRMGRDDLFIVKREIAPAHIYKQLWEEARPDIRNYSARAVQGYLERLFGKGNVVAGKGFTPPAVR